jgi:hypothetical protein
MSPDEVRGKTKGLLQPTKSALPFVVKEANPDDNVNIQILGDVRRQVPTDAAARRFLATFAKQYPALIRQQVPGARVTASRIVDLAGGVAFEAEMTSMRGSTEMKQRSVMLLVGGKGFTITCTARAADFSDTDRDAFRPILDSLHFS